MAGVRVESHSATAKAAAAASGRRGRQPELPAAVQLGAFECECQTAAAAAPGAAAAGGRDRRPPAPAPAEDAPALQAPSGPAAAGGGVAGPQQRSRPAARLLWRRRPGGVVVGPGRGRAACMLSVVVAFIKIKMEMQSLTAPLLAEESVFVEPSASPQSRSGDFSPAGASVRARRRRKRLMSAINSPDYTELLHLNLASKLTLHQYWIGLVYRLGFDAQVYQTHSVPSLDILSRYFDTTQLGMLRVFHMFDRDHDNNLTTQEIARGLQQQGLFTNAGAPVADEAFRELCVLLAPPVDPTVSVSVSASEREASETREARVRAPEFLAVLKNLRLAALVCGPAVDISSMKLHLHEYREDQLFAACPLETPLDFVFADEASSLAAFRVRWVHVHEATRLEILALGMKYGLDPRFVSDVFTLWREPAKCDQVNRYGSGSPLEDEVSPTPIERPLWFFVVVPVLRLSDQSKEAMRPYLAWKRLKLKKLTKPDQPPDVHVVVEHCNLAIFVTGQPQGGTVLSFTSDRIQLFKLSTAGRAGAVPVADAPAAAAADLDLFSRTLVQLRTSYSRLRTGDAHTFVMRTVAEVTEDYSQVTEAFDAALSILQKRLETERDKIAEKDVKRIQKAVVQLGSLFRIVRPMMTSSIMHIDSHAAFGRSPAVWSSDALLYVSDVRANVQRFMDDINALKEIANMLFERFHQYSNSKTQSVLYALTLVTTVFVPGQFLTGLYGMNFQNPASGKPGMPELLWEHGYLFFWILNIFITGLTFVYYRKQHWI